MSTTAVSTPSRPVLSKAFVFDGPGGVRIQKADGPSKQLPDDPFGYATGMESGLQRPIYDLESLSRHWTEVNSLHGRCVRQKAGDALGRGLTLRAKDPGVKATPPAEEEDRYNAFVEAVASDDDRDDVPFAGRILQAALDFEGIGWGILEVGRKTDGSIDGLWYVPAHTIRAHKDGKRYAQKRGGKTAWFKRFGIDGTVSAQTGAWSDQTVNDTWTGNELIVIKAHTPRSSYYGAPDHIPAMAALAGWNAQAEFNLKFFDNLAVPSYVIVIEGADVTPELEEQIKRHFLQIKGQPSSTMVLPVPSGGGKEELRPKVTFERLTVDVKDATHRMYRLDNATEILISHAMPPYRVGWPIVGSLGGDVAVEMTHIYLDSVVQTRQEMWEQRLQRSLLGPRGLDIREWAIKANTLDSRDELHDLAVSKERYMAGVATPADVARFIGVDPRKDEAGTAYIDHPYSPTASRETVAATPADIAPVDEAVGPADAEAVTKYWRSSVRDMVRLTKAVERIESLVPTEVAA